MISLKLRAVIVIVILLIAGLIAFYFIWKARQPPVEQTVQQEIKSNIAKGGVFFVGPPDSAKNQSLIYRDKSNNYYNAGTCSDCGTACAKAIPIQDINKTDCSSGICKPVLVSSAKEVTALYLQKAGNNIMTQVDCAAVIDTSGDPNATYVNIQTMALFAQSSNDLWMDFKSFLSKHRDQILEIIGFQGVQTALSHIIGEYAIIVMVIPGLMSADTRTSSELQIAYFGGKAALKDLAKILGNFGADVADKLITTGTETAMDVAIRGATECLAKTYARIAARAVSKALFAAIEALNPAFVFFDFVMIAGMVFDIIDPCGLNNTLSKDDIDSVKKAFDYALFSVMLDSTGTGTPEWYAEYITEYGLVCPDTDSGTSDTLTLSRTELDYLTRPENIFKGTDDSCKDDELKLRMTYSELYQASLTVNSLGQCVRPMTKQELDDVCSSALGIPVDLPVGKDLVSGANNGVFSQFKKAAEYISLQLADNNQIVANFMTTYWYIVVLILIIIAVIAFFL